MTPAPNSEARKRLAIVPPLEPIHALAYATGRLLALAEFAIDAAEDAGATGPLIARHRQQLAAIRADIEATR